MNEIGDIKTEVERVSAIVDQLFEHFGRLIIGLKGMFPSQHEFQQVKNLWIETFCEEKITAELARAGWKVTKLKNSGFLPTVGQFIANCYEAGVHDIPEREIAYQEAAKNAHVSVRDPRWTHTVCKRAYELTGASKFSEMRWTELEKIFNKNYIRAVKEYANGQLKPLLALEQFEPKKPEAERPPNPDNYLWAKINFYTPDANGVRPCDVEKPRYRVQRSDEQHAYGETRLADVMAKLGVKRLPLPDVD